LLPKVKLKKYQGTIRVILPENREPDHPASSLNPDLCGYYRSFSAYAPTDSDAISLLNKSVADGRIDWSSSDLTEVKKALLDWFRMIAGPRVIHQSGRAFFPFEDVTANDNDESPVGWRMKN
jgi:hypothetical protein